MNSILLSTSIGLNLIFCTLIVHLCYNTEFSLDKARNDYIKDLRYFHHRGCMGGIDYQESDTNSPVGYCAKLTEELEEEFMRGMFKLGRK